MRERVLFFRCAAVYWKEFQQISEHGVDRTALMQGIIDKAKEKDDLSWLLSDAKRKSGFTFLEVWEMVIGVNTLRPHVERHSFESQEIMYESQKLFTATRKSLQEKKVFAQDLISHIECLGATKPTKSYNYTGNKPLRHKL